MSNNANTQTYDDRLTPVSLVEQQFSAPAPLAPGIVLGGTHLKTYPNGQACLEGGNVTPFDLAVDRERFIDQEVEAMEVYSGAETGSDFSIDLIDTAYKMLTLYLLVQILFLLRAHTGIQTVFGWYGYVYRFAARTYHRIRRTLKAILTDPQEDSTIVIQLGRNNDVEGSTVSNLTVSRSGEEEDNEKRDNGPEPCPRLVIEGMADLVDADVGHTYRIPVGNGVSKIVRIEVIEEVGVAMDGSHANDACVEEVQDREIENASGTESSEVSLDMLVGGIAERATGGAHYMQYPPVELEDIVTPNGSPAAIGQICDPLGVSGLVNRLEDANREHAFARAPGAQIHVPLTRSVLGLDSISSESSPVATPRMARLAPRRETSLPSSDVTLNRLAGYTWPGDSNPIPIKVKETVVPRKLFRD